MAYDIPGGIGATGYSDTADILSRLDRLRESGPRRTQEDPLTGAGRPASLEEVRDLLGQGSGIPEAGRPTASAAALEEIRDLLTDAPVLLQESTVKAVILEESGRLVSVE